MMSIAVRRPSEFSVLEYCGRYEAPAVQEHTEPLAADLDPHAGPVPAVCQPPGRALQAPGREDHGNVGRRKHEDEVVKIRPAKHSMLSSRKPEQLSQLSGIPKAAGNTGQSFPDRCWANN